MSDAVYPKLVRGDRDHKGCLWGVSAGRAQGDVCGALNVLEHVTHEICALDSALIPPQNTAHLCPRRLPGRLSCEAPSPGSILTCGGRGTGCACSALPVSPLFPGSSPPDVFFIKELVSFEANTGEWSPCSHRACLVLISGALGTDVNSTGACRGRGCLHGRDKSLRQRGSLTSNVIRWQTPWDPPSKHIQVSTSHHSPAASLPHRPPQGPRSPAPTPPIPSVLSPQQPPWIPTLFSSNATWAPTSRGPF